MQSALRRRHPDTDVLIAPLQDTRRAGIHLVASRGFASRAVRGTRSALRIFMITDGPTWQRARQRLRRQFSELADEDLVLIEGREEDLLESLAHKTGRSRAAIVDAFHAVGMFRAVGGDIVTRA